jgi:hypothetical protein
MVKEAKILSTVVVLSSSEKNEPKSSLRQKIGRPHPHLSPPASKVVSIGKEPLTHFFDLEPQRNNKEH